MTRGGCDPSEWRRCSLAFHVVRVIDSAEVVRKWERLVIACLEDLKREMSNKESRGSDAQVNLDIVVDS